VTLASSGGSTTPWNAANTGNFSYPIDLVFDAFGNLVVADYNAAKVFSFNQALAEKTISTGAITLGAPGAIKVDLAGDVLIADDGNAPRVVMVPGETYDTTYKPSVLLDSTSVSYPQALAVDNAGTNLYVGDAYLNQVLKVALNGTGTSQVAIAPCAADVTPCAFNAPTGIAFDPNGDMYVTDGTPRLLMVPANHSSGGQTILMPMTGLVNPTSVAVDGSGNIYVTDYVGTLTKLSVNVGAMKVAASDPQTTTVTNTGNLDLTIASLTFTNGAGSAFSETDTCTSAPVPPGGSCTITVSYSNPAGTAPDTLNISSNAFSLSGVTIQLSH
jgi:sugar lactone lactonase YvrE